MPDGPSAEAGKYFSAEAPLFSPQAHAHRRHQEQVEPRMPGEKGYERSFAALEETAHGESEKSREQQENHEKHISDGRRKVAAQLALHDGLDVVHRIHRSRLTQPLLPCRAA